MNFSKEYERECCISVKSQTVVRISVVWVSWTEAPHLYMQFSKVGDGADCVQVSAVLIFSALRVI